MTDPSAVSTQSGTQTQPWHNIHKSYNDSFASLGENKFVYVQKLIEIHNNGLIKARWKFDLSVIWH